MEQTPVKYTYIEAMALIVFYLKEQDHIPRIRRNVETLCAMFDAQAFAHAQDITSKKSQDGRLPKLRPRLLRQMPEEAAVDLWYFVKDGCLTPPLGARNIGNWKKVFYSLAY